MKIVLCMLIVTCGGYIGYILNKNYRKKEKLYLDMVNFCREYRCNLNYRQDTLEKVLLKGNYSDEFCSLVDKYLREKNANTIFFETNELQYIEDFFGALGKSDAYNEENGLTFFEEYFQSKLIEIREINKIKCQLTLKLSILVSFLLCVVII